MELAKIGGPEKGGVCRIALKDLERKGRDLFVFDGYAGADPRYRLKVRVITENAWHCLFAQNMFIRESDPEVLRGFEPSFVVWNVASLAADPAQDGTRTGTFILLDLAKRLRRCPP